MRLLSYDEDLDLSKRKLKLAGHIMARFFLSSSEGLRCGVTRKYEENRAEGGHILASSRTHSWSDVHNFIDADATNSWKKDASEAEPELQQQGELAVEITKGMIVKH